MVKRLSGVDQNSQTLTNVPTPSNGGDAANKDYVDAVKYLPPNPYIESANLYLIGHSFTMLPYPYTKNPFATEYGVRVRDRLNMGDYHWHGRSGTIAESMFGRLISPVYDFGSGTWTPDSKGVVMIENYMNEMSSIRSLDFRNLWANSIRGLIAVSNSQSIKGYDERSSISGSWAAHSGATGGVGKAVGGATYYAASNSGAYLEWTVDQGDEVWIVGVASIVSYPVGSLQVRCNGNLLATINGSGLKPDYNDPVAGVNLSYTPVATRVKGLNAAAGTTGSKTVRVTVSGSGNSFISGVIVPSPTPPRVFLAKEPPRGYPAIEAWVEQHQYYDDMIETIASEFTNVNVVDLLPGWDGATMITSNDTNNPAIHPNDVGQEHIASKFAQRIYEDITEFDPGVLHI